MSSQFFYGCTPQADGPAWCASCEASPAVIEYRSAPITELVSRVMEQSELGKRLEFFIENEYKIDCLPGYRWSKETGFCVRMASCQPGSYTVVTSPTQTIEHVGGDKACICDCTSITQPNPKSVLKIVIPKTNNM